MKIWRFVGMNCHIKIVQVLFSDFCRVFFRRSLADFLSDMMVSYESLLRFSRHEEVEKWQRWCSRGWGEGGGQRFGPSCVRSGGSSSTKSTFQHVDKHIRAHTHKLDAQSQTKRNPGGKKSKTRPTYIYTALTAGEKNPIPGSPRSTPHITLFMKRSKNRMPI